MSDPRIRTATGPTILLASGHYFDLLDPAHSRFTLGDIAQGLANTCRFAGQCSRFYSVAEHSFHASFIVPDDLALAALMHDAAEAFIGDVTSPLKSLLPDYKRIERAIEAVIAERFGLGDACDHPAIKQADLRMLASEQAQLMPARAGSWAILHEIEPAHFDLSGRVPVPWREAWLGRFAMLTRLPDVAALERLA